MPPVGVLWVRVRSWHAYGLHGRTLCGRLPMSDAPTSEALPSGKSCELCLRIVARQADQ